MLSSIHLSLWSSPDNKAELRTFMYALSLRCCLDLQLMIVPSPYAEKLRTLPIHERTIDVCGSTTHYWEYGNASNQCTILMIHGFRGDHHGLEPIVAQLGFFHVIAPDLPGFGKSIPLSTAHDLDGYVQWLRSFVASLALPGKIVILGHSFGSILVSAACAEGDAQALHPGQIVLINPIGAPALSGPRGIFTQLAVFYYWLSAILPERIGFALLRNRLIVRVSSLAMVKSGDARLRRWIHNQHDRYFSAFEDRSVVLDAFRASVSHDVSEFAARIPEHTLLIAAEKDDITSVASQRRLVTQFPNASLTIIPHVGHLIHYETPVAAGKAISSFLGSEDRA